MDKQKLIERIDTDHARQRAIDRELQAGHDDGGPVGVGAQACVVDASARTQPRREMPTLRRA